MSSVIVPPGFAPSTGAAGPTASFTSATAPCCCAPSEVSRPVPVLPPHAASSDRTKRTSSEQVRRNRKVRPSSSLRLEVNECGSSARPRVESVAHRIAEEVEGQHEQEDRQP